MSGVPSRQTRHAFDVIVLVVCHCPHRSLSAVRTFECFSSAHQMPPTISQLKGENVANSVTPATPMSMKDAATASTDAVIDNNDGSACVHGASGAAGDH